MRNKILKLLAIVITWMYLSSCSHKYYATESWKAKVSNKEWNYKTPKQKHTFKGNGSYF